MPSNDSTTRICKKCGGEKPLTDFPKSPTCKEGRMWTCKVCHKHLKANPTFKNDNGRVGWEQEKKVYDLLRSMGIYAQPGINTLWNRADVVAWGCVRIEVKATRRNDAGSWNWNFSNQNREDRIKGDLVVLCAVDGESATYHVFKKDAPCFYKEDGTVKRNVVYAPNRTTTRSHWHALLTDADMDAARDAWGLVEECRQHISQSLSSGEYVEPIEEQNHSRRAHAASRQPSRYRGEL